MLSKTLILLLLTLGPQAGDPVEPAPPSPVPGQPDDLAAKLMRKTVEESQKEDLMAELMRTMSDIAEKLQVDFDPGEPTQMLQRQAAAKLDEAIKEAAARRKVRSQPDPKQVADKRTLPSAKSVKPAKAPGRERIGDGQEERKTTDGAAATAQEEHRDQGKLRDARRGWGHLPQRERDEVIQGADEEFLERFRPWVERYYRALQESDH